MTQPPNHPIAQSLRQRFGILPGDRLGVVGDFGEMRPVYEALWVLGACAVPLDVGTLKNTETLNASNAIYLIASETRLARAVQAVEPGVHDLVGARNVREVIQFGGTAGEVFPYLEPILETSEVSEASEVCAAPDLGNNTSEALRLYLYFMGKVQAFSYTVAELREVPTRLKLGKPRPKFAVVGFYPVVEELIHMAHLPSYGLSTCKEGQGVR